MKNRFIFVILSLFIIFGLVIFNNNETEVEVVSQSYKEDNKLSTSNDDLFNRIDRLEKLADSYITERGIKANKVELCLQYLRKDRYNNEKWTSLLGPIDGTFVEYVKTHDSELTFSNNEVIYDLGTGRTVDFIHMSASLNSYIRYGDKVKLIVATLSTDYAGWAGDLVTFMEEITNYRLADEASIEDLEHESEEEKAARVKKYQDYAISLLGTNGESTMSSSDVLADFDAYNIYHDSSLNVKGGLYNALIKYYKSYESSSNVTNRFTTIRKTMGDTEEKINNYVRPYLTNMVVKQLFLPKTYDKVSEDDVNVTLKAFSNYLLENVYVDIVPLEADAVVGEEVKIKLIENHLNIAKVDVVPPELAEAKISGEYIVVNPKKAGEVEIVVSNMNGSITKSYKFKIVNVPPEIIKGLDSSYYFNDQESETLSIEAKGTNNIYTWYIADNNVMADWEVLAETSSSSYVLTPSKDMDGKYIKCGVKNDGHEEVFSNETVLVISGSKFETAIRKNNTLVIVIIIVLLILLGGGGVLVYFKVIKPKIEKKKEEERLEQERILQEQQAAQLAAEQARKQQEESSNFYGYF